MNTILDFLRSPASERIAWVLVHSLWQLALLAGCYVLIGQFLRRRSAAARYLAGCAIMSCMVLVLPVTALFVTVRPPIVVADHSYGENTQSGGLLAVGGNPDGVMVEEMAPLGSAPELRSVPVVLPTAGEVAVAPVVPAAVATWNERIRGFLAPVIPWIVGVWLAGVFVLASRQLGGWMAVRRLCGTGTGAIDEVRLEKLRQIAGSLGVRRAVRLLTSIHVDVPSVVGHLKPVILLPVSLLSGLSPREFEAIMAHEMAHIRRHDYLVNLIQASFETVLFYHPAVWWVSREIRRERENCCDDLAVRVCGDRVAYARALAVLEESRVPLPAAAMAATGGSLIERIRRLIGHPAAAHAPRGTWLAGALAILTVCVLLPIGLAAGSGKADEFDFDDPPGGYEKGIRMAKPDHSIKVGGLRFRLSNLDRNEEGFLEADLGTGGGFEVFSFRLFDHATRELLHDSDWQLHNPGQCKFTVERVGADNRIRMKETGGVFPEKIDLWLRLIEIRPGGKIRLPARDGGSGRSGKSEIVVKSLLEGSMNGLGEQHLPGKEMLWDLSKVHGRDTSLTVNIENRGDVLRGLHHLVAMRKDGSRYVHDHPYYFTPGRRFNYARLYLPVADVDHFELVRLRSKEHHKFFFNGVAVPGVTLPKLSGKQRREVKRLVKRAATKSEPEREEVVKSLVAMGPGVAPEMIPMLQRGPTDVVAMLVLEQLSPDPAVQSLLVKVIKEARGRHSNVVHCGLFALGKSGNRDHADFIAEFLSESKIAAVSALRELGGDQARDHLIAAFETLPVERWSLVAGALRELGDPAAVGELKRRLAEVELASGGSATVTTVSAMTEAIAALSGRQLPTAHEFCQGQHFRYPYDGPGSPKTFSVNPPRDHFVKLRKADPDTAKGRDAIWTALEDATEGPGFTIDGDEIILFKGLKAAPLWPAGRPYPTTLYDWLRKTSHREIRDEIGRVHRGTRQPIPKNGPLAALDPAGNLYVLGLKKTSPEFSYNVFIEPLDPSMQLVPPRRKPQAIRMTEWTQCTLHDLESARKDGVLNLSRGRMDTLTEDRWNSERRDALLTVEFASGGMALAVGGAQEFRLVEAKSAAGNPQQVVQLLKAAVGNEPEDGHKVVRDEGGIFHVLPETAKGRTYAFAVVMPDGLPVAGLIEISDADRKAETLKIKNRFLPTASARQVFAPGGGPGADHAPGISVEVLGVADIPSNGRWWDADGNVVDNIYWDDTAVNHEQTKDNRQVILRMNSTEVDPELKPMMKLSVHRKSTPAGSWSGGGFVYKDRQTLEDLSRCTFSLHDEHAAVDITATVSYGPWQTLATRDAASQGDLTSTFTNAGTVIFNDPVSRDGKSTISLTLLAQLETARFIAVDKEGKTHVCGSMVSSGISAVASHNSPAHQLYKSEVSLPLSAIDKFLFQTRSSKKTSFKNIALHPDAATKLEDKEAAVLPKMVPVVSDAVGVTFDRPAEWIVDQGPPPRAGEGVDFIQPDSMVDLVRASLRVSGEENGGPASIDVTSPPNPKATASRIFKIDGEPARLTAFRVGQGDAELLTVQVARGTRSYDINMVFPRKHHDEYLRLALAICKSLRFQEWGEPVERVVSFDFYKDKAYLDLDTGLYGKEQAGKDIISAMGESDMRVRAGLEMVAIPVDASRWDSTPGEARKAVAGGKVERQARLGGGESRRTFFFKTREGGTGVLRISPKAGEPGNVTVRYKMLVRVAADTDGAIQALQSVGAKLTFDEKGGIAEVYFGSKATDERLQLLKGLTHLKKLNLENARISDGSLVNLAGLTGLEDLSLYQTGITDAGLVHIQGLGNLRNLMLHGNAVTDAGLKNLEGMANLEELDISHTMSADNKMQIGDAGLRHLKRLTKLKVLDLKRTDVTAAGLAHLTDLPDLEMLWLSGPAITDAAMEPLAAMKGLRRLGLRFTGVSDAGMIHLREMPQLEQLGLDSRQVSDTGLAHIEALKQLTMLELRGPHFGDASLQYVAKLPRLVRLDLMDWSGDRARGGGDAGKPNYTAAGLAVLHKIKTLRTLWLNNVRLGKAELDQLKPLKHLEELTILTPRFADTVADEALRRQVIKARQELRRALPETKVHVGGFGFDVPDSPEEDGKDAWRDEESAKLIGLPRNEMMKQYGRPMIWNGEPFDKFSDAADLKSRMPKGHKIPQVWGFQFQNARPDASLIVRMWVGDGKVFDAYWCRPAKENQGFFNPPVRERPLADKGVGQVEGRVVDSTGQPVADASVWGAWTTGKGSGSAPSESFKGDPATTDADGQFRLTGLPAGSIDIVCKWDHWDVPVRNHTVLLPAGQTMRVKVVVPGSSEPENTADGVQVREVPPFHRFADDPDFAQALRFDREMGHGRKEEKERADRDKAAKFYLKYLEKDGIPPYQRARVYVQLGIQFTTLSNPGKGQESDVERARRYFEKAIELDPDRISRSMIRARTLLGSLGGTTREESFGKRMETYDWLLSLDEAAIEKRAFPVRQRTTIRNLIEAVKGSTAKNVVSAVSSFPDGEARLRKLIEDYSGTPIVEIARKQLQSKARVPNGPGARTGSGR